MHYLSTIMIKGLVSTQQNQRYFRIKRAVNLFYDQPFNLIHRLLALAIRYKMLVDLEMNCRSKN
jgi:hypothetical protein